MYIGSRQQNCNQVLKLTNSFSTTLSSNIGEPQKIKKKKRKIGQNNFKSMVVTYTAKMLKTALCVCLTA